MAQLFLTPTSAYEELAGSPQVGTTAGKLTATRRFRVDGSHLINFIGDLWGRYLRVGNQVYISGPAYFGNFKNVIVNAVDAEPFLGDGGVPGTISDLNATPDYSDWLITAKYENVPGSEDNSGKPTVPNETFLTYSTDIGAEYMTIPGRKWHWTGTSINLEEDVNAGLLIPTETITMTWHRVALPPVTAIRNCRGCINAATFLNHTAGCVLFLGAKISRDFQVIDTGLWKVEYQFKVKENEPTYSGTAAGTKFGWNYFYRSPVTAAENWQEILNENTEPPYRDKDFTTLFTYEP